MLRGKKLRVWGVGLLLFLLPFSASAGELKGLVERALKENHGLKGEGWSTVASKEEYLASWGLFFPRLWFQEEGFRSNNPPFVWMTKMSRRDVTLGMMNLEGFNRPHAVTDFKSSVNVAWPLFHGGEVYSTVMMNRAFYHSAQRWLGSNKERVALMVVERYLEAAWARSRVEAARLAVESARGHVSTAQARFKRGMALRADVLRAKVYLASMEDRLAREETAWEVAKRSLSLVVGGDPRVPVEIKGDLKSLYGDLRDFHATLDSLVSRALEKRGDYLAQKARVEAERYGVKRAKSDYFPKIDLMASWEWHGHNFPGDSDASNWMVGGVAKINIFDGFAREHRVRKARALLAMERERVEEKRRELVLEVVSGLLKVREARKRVDSSRSSVEEAKEALRVVEKRYGAGLATIVEVNDAQSALVEARSLYLGALHDYLAALYTLQYSTGGLLDFMGVEE